MVFLQLEWDLIARVRLKSSVEEQGGEAQWRCWNKIAHVFSAVRRYFASFSSFAIFGFNKAKRRMNENRAIRAKINSYTSTK